MAAPKIVFAPRIFALDLHSPNIADVVIIAAIIFNLLHYPVPPWRITKKSGVNWLAEIVPMHFKCHLD